MRATPLYRHEHRCLPAKVNGLRHEAMPPVREGMGWPGKIGLAEMAYFT